MASDNLSAPDFLSLYHLKFYRNKKNWKLCSNKESSSAEAQGVLNETFDVDQKEALNMSFIESDSDSENSITVNSSKSRLSTQQLDNINIWPTTTQQQYVPDDDHYLEHLILGKKMQYEDKAVNMTPPERDIPHTDGQTQDPQIPLNTPQNINTGDSCRSRTVQDRIQELVKAAQYCAYDHGDSPQCYQEEWEPESDHQIHLQETRSCPEMGIPQDNFEENMFVPPHWLPQSAVDTMDEDFDECEMSVWSEYVGFERGAHLRHHSSYIHLHQQCMCSEPLSVQQLPGEQLASLWQRGTKLMTALATEITIRESISQEIEPDDPNAEFLAGSFQNKVFQCEKCI